MKQGSAIRADDIDHRAEGRCNVIASRGEGDQRNKDRSFHESRVRPRGKEDRGVKKPVEKVAAGASQEVCIVKIVKSAAKQSTAVKADAAEQFEAERQ